MPVSVTLTSHPWQWTSFVGAAEQFKVEQTGSYLLTFKADGTLAIKADCNNAFADYVASAGSLAIKPGPMTLAACPPGSRGEQFVKLVGSAAKYFIADGALFIELFADGGIMRLDPVGKALATPSEADQAARLAQVYAAELRRIPWKWSTFTSAAEIAFIDSPASYKLTFKEDGTLHIKADCNTAAGAYTLDGTKITIKIGQTTQAACPGASRGEQLLRLLGDAAEYVATNGKLTLRLRTAGSSMLFNAAPTTAADLCGDKALAINTSEDTLDPKLSTRLDDVLKSVMTEGQRPSPGAAMLIITPKGRYAKSIGVAEVSTCKPLPADSPYQIGSNTKLMTSAILFQLQEEGVLKTADPLSKWLPDLAARLPNGDKVTIDMLLTHTSGLPDYFDVPTKSGKTIADGVADKAMLTRNFTPVELVTLVADAGRSDFAPGAEGQWKYSNTGYILLGLIIEKATGKSYEDNLKTRIFAPLGLKQTYLQAGQPKPGALPQAYFTSPFSFSTGEWNASQGWSAGAVVSTAEDFALFLKSLFTGKLFKQPGTLALMQQAPAKVVDPLGPGTVYAHGMLINSGVLGHGGQTLGFKSDGGYVPGKDVTIVMWGNAAETDISRTIVPVVADIATGAGQ